MLVQFKNWQHMLTEVETKLNLFLLLEKEFFLRRTLCMKYPSLVAFFTNEPESQKIIGGCFTN